MAVGLQLLTLVAMAMSGVMTMRREEVFSMEMKIEETEKRQDPVNLPNLPDLVKELKLSKLLGAVLAAGLAKALSEKDPLTLFAPTNKAFDDAAPWVAQLVKNKTALQEVLTYHVLDGMAVLSKDIKDELSVKTLMGQPIRFNIYPNNKVVTAQCAPIDLNNVDKMASNGVLHELGALMVPPKGNIVVTTVQLSGFSTLVKLLTIAGLVDTLAGDGPFTVFAPTDAAFAQLKPETLAYLMKNKTALTDVLLYHVAKLTYCRAGLVSYKELEMLNMQKIQIAVSKGGVTVNKIPVMDIGVDGSVTNGVIHKIESVLIPPYLGLHP